MPNSQDEPRSRRALLAAAAGGAAALAASAALPLTTLAADPFDVVLGGDNASTTQTSITQATDGVVAFKATTATTGAAGLIGSNGDDAFLSPDTSFTGVYGWSPTTGSDFTFSAGIWGDSDDVGVYGSGTVGVRGDGFWGVLGFGDVGGIGVRAIAATPTDVALSVAGKVVFSRSGRSTIGAGKSSIKVTLAGTTAGSRVFAVLHSNRSGRYVRAVVPTTGSFTIYLNTTVTSSTYIAWFVIN